MLWRWLKKFWNTNRRQLIVMRLADMIFVHPQDNSRVCDMCGEQVGIYPSGQALLKKYPAMRIVCHVCCKPESIHSLAPGAEYERFESKQRIP